MLIVVILLVVGAVLISSAAVGGARENHLAAEGLATLQAFYAAEAGMNLAVRELILNIDEDGDGVIGGIASDSPGAQIAGATLRVELATDLGDTILTSTGRAEQATRRMTARLVGSAGASGGLRASYFALSFAPSRISDIDWDAPPTATQIVEQINYPRTSNSTPFWPDGPNNHYAAEFTGNINIGQAGFWTFYTESDDGSILWINDILVVDNDGLHAMRERSGVISLPAGKHAFRVRYFERTGNHGLIVSWRGPGVPGKTIIPAAAFTH